MSYLKNIPRTIGGGHLGGVLSLTIYRVVDVLDLPVAINGTIYGNITLRPGGEAFKWIVGYQSAGIKTSSKPSREGPAKESELEFTISLDTDIRAMLSTAERDQFIVLFTYPNGKTKTFGTPQAPVQFRFDHDSGTGAGSKNGYACQFYYAGPDNTFFYAGEIPAPPVTTTPAIVRFNGVAIASLQPGESLNIESDYSFNQYFIIQ